ncbi:MAG: ribosome recycling factor [Sedimentisphaerales bacterium]|nr:ribosome recycling factor [Sedimentisphaerales bacterium]
MAVKDIVLENRTKMNKAVEVFADELKAVRSGRASTGLVENLRVDYYGTQSPLKTIAAVTVPQHDMILIKPFDPGSVREIEKAIKNSDLSIAPIVDKGLIRLSIPPLNEERRRGLVNQVKHMSEQAKVSIRNIRRDAIKHLEKQEKEKAITEDDLKNGKKQIDDLTKEYTDKIDEVVRHKSDEIMLD